MAGSCNTARDPADGDAVGAAIGEKATSAKTIRFVLPDEATSEERIPRRLNVMIATTGVVRDLRCG